MFGLFGSTRRTATEACVNAIRPIIGAIQASHGIPRGFWTDHYVLGFLTVTIDHHAKLATRGKATGAILGFVLSDVMTTLSNMNGTEIVRRSTAIAMEPDADFKRGADDAAAICFYTMGFLKNEKDNPLVRGASKLADPTSLDDTSDAGRRSRIAGMMVVLSLVKEVTAVRLSVD
jgi:hypothetical protein